MKTTSGWIAFFTYSVLSVSSDCDANPKAEPLDQAKVHSWYYAGKVDSALSAMERFQKKNPAYSQTDSLFLFKYLGVIYSMNPKNRHKGTNLFQQLLALDSSAEISDLYASEEVDSIFNVLKQTLKPRPILAADSLQQPVHLGAADENPPAKPSPSDSSLTSPPSQAAGKSQRKKLFWTATGFAAATAVGVTTWFWVNSENQPKTHSTALWDGTNSGK